MTANALAHVVHYTDPGCPYAWNAEPLLLHLRWRYREQLSWETLMVGLAETAEVYAEKGFTPRVFNLSWREFASDYPMPIYAAPRDRVGGTGPACRAVVAAQLHAPEKAEALLRALRVRFFAGGFLDREQTIEQAAQDAGIDPHELQRWAKGDDVSSLYGDAMTKARTPSPEALAQNARLADVLPQGGGGRRYTCPSLEVTRLSDGARMSAPGYQQFKAYELLLANLLPKAEQRPDATSVQQIFAFEPRWPLATAEIEQLRGGISREQARDELRKAGAKQQRIGSDSLWTL